MDRAKDALDAPAASVGIPALHVIPRTALQARPQLSQTRPARIHWATLAFLLGFSVLLIFICYYYLFPALEAARQASPEEKRTLSAHATLLLAVVLVILLSGIILTFRIGRFFFPGAAAKRERTKYTDAWAEAGRRLDPPEKSEDEG